MSFRCTKAIPNVIEKIIFRPWELQVDPFQVSPRTYYVSGQKWVGSYIIDTGAGLIMIDAGIAETVYLEVDALYKLGYKPSDVKMILLSHAHLDHFGGAEALHQLTGAPLYMSREDYKFLQDCPEETELPQELWHVQHLHGIDGFYDDNKAIVLGDIAIRTLLTPGHTPGCTSFFWDEKNPVTGETYTLAMHGGVGANTMNDAYYSSSKYLTPSLRDQFMNDAAKLKKIHVDIALPSHPNQIEILDQAGTYTDQKQPYLDSTIWADFIDERVRQVKELMQ